MARAPFRVAARAAVVLCCLLQGALGRVHPTREYAQKRRVVELRSFDMWALDGSQARLARPAGAQAGAAAPAGAGWRGGARLTGAMRCCCR